MQEAGVTIKGVDKTLRWLEKNRAGAEKAMNTAIRVEGFRLRKLMQREIRAGAPGGRRFAPLTDIAKRLDSQQSARRNPLRNLAKVVRYRTETTPKFRVEVGFLQPGAGTHTLSKSWLKIARNQQRGFTRTITEKQRGWIIRRGAALLGWDRTLGGDTSYSGKYGGNLEAAAGNTPFFLKKSTKTFTTPARPIIAPFWQAHQNSVRRNIAANFKRKMAGQRI